MEKLLCRNRLRGFSKKEPSQYQADITANKQPVCTKSGHEPKIWDVVTGKELCTLAGHISAVDGCTISRDGKWIVSASSDKTLKVWDMRTGRCILTFPVDGELYDCAFHPDGEHLVACGDQGIYFLRLVV